jgi:arginyl-tRNA synthetase
MSFEERLAGAVREAVRRAYGVELAGVHVERPNDPSHGDFATNVVRAAEVAGPGFINFRLSEEALWDEVGSLLDEGDGYGRREASGRPVLLEFVSVNPTGPMTVAHGRHAAYGDSLARIMEAAGRAVAREYYFNDGGNQIRLLAESVAARYAGLYESMWPVSDPDALYRGEYVTEIARDFAGEHGDAYVNADRDKALTEISDFGTLWCMEGIKKTLARARVHFDAYFNEKSLYQSGAVEALIQELRDAGHAYESEGAVWLATSGFGDDKDRVLVKRDGTYTYMGPDLAYHRDKWDRGFGTAVDVLGADHAGYPPRIRAGLVALGIPRTFLDVELIRLVKLVRGGEQVKVSKRAGTFVTFDEVLNEVGEDVARYFYVRSSHKTEMNFDLDLAIEQSDENPVFYVQYAHARIASIFERAGTSTGELAGIPAGELAPEERRLALELLDFPRVVETAATRREVHLIPTYLETLATRFHQFYTVHRVLVDDADLRARRLALCAATKNVLRVGLGLLGVNAPEKM